MTSSSFCNPASTSDLEASAVSTRWGTFAVEVPSLAGDSSDSSDYNNYYNSWATRASNHSSPKSSSSRDLPASDRQCRFGSLYDQGQQGPPPTEFRGSQIASVSAPFFTNQVMVKNILNRFTKKEFTDFLDSIGLEGTYNGVYLPIGRTRKGKTSNLGYAFVDFRGMEEVDLCRSLLHGMVVGIPGQQKCIEIAPVTTHHPSRKFHRNGKRDGEDEDDDFSGEEAVAGPSGGSLMGDYQQLANSTMFPAAVELPPARGPTSCSVPLAYQKAPTAPAATYSQGEINNPFCTYSSPFGDYDDRNQSWVRMPMACNNPSLKPRHLAPVAPVDTSEVCCHFSF